MNTPSLPTPTRRQVVGAAAWTLPVVAVAGAAPAFASSTPVACTPGATVAYSNRAWATPWTAANIQDHLRWNEVTAPGTPLPGIPESEIQSYQNIYTGWRNTSAVGDNSLIAVSDYAGGPMNVDGFVSGADNVSSGQTVFTVSYQFPVAAGATYSLDAKLYAGAGYLVGQRLSVAVDGPGVSADLAKITSLASWASNVPAGFTPLEGSTTRSTTVSPTANGLLTVSYTFELDGVTAGWPAAGYQRNGDISVDAPVLTTTSCA